MKLGRWFKIVLLTTLGAVYFSGVAYWWMNEPVGSERPAAAGPVLHAHSIAGLWFLIVFGYLFRSHIQAGLRSEQRRLSGLLMLVLTAILIATVPGLFYLVNEEQKLAVGFLHTYLGLGIIVPFLAHSYRWRASRTPVSKPLYREKYSPEPPYSLRDH